MADDARPEIERKEIELDKLIGEGAFGKVYRGKCRGKEVAVKTFKKENVSKTDLENFRDEVQIMSKISHPNILLFMGVCTQGDEVMVITPLMPTDLETLIITKKDTEPISLYQRLRMMKDAALGMNWLHESNPVFIHRDLKLSNLLVDEALNVYVCDFGLTRMKPKEETNLEYDPHGSPLYMAPEVFIGDFNEKCDVYSYGICLWETLTQTQAFADLASNLPAFIHAVVDKNERPPIPANCPASLRQLIEDCWQADPEKRPPFKEIIPRLDTILVDVAIHDEGGRKLWKHRSMLGKEEVSWLDFAKRISTHLHKISAPDLDSPKYRCLKALVVTDSMKKVGTKDVVTLTNFGAFLDWFGPLEADASGITVLDRVESILRNRWFHGDLQLNDAVLRLSGQPVGTFLVRFSSQPGCFAVSYVYLKDGKPQNAHQRITYNAASGIYLLQSLPDAPFKSLKDLIMANKKACGFSAPCPGSKYVALFQAPSSDHPTNLYMAPEPSQLPPSASTPTPSTSSSTPTSSSSKHHHSSKSGKSSKSGSSSSKHSSKSGKSSSSKSSSSKSSSSSSSSSSSKSRSHKSSSNLKH